MESMVRIAEHQEKSSAGVCFTKKCNELNKCVETETKERITKTVSTAALQIRRMAEMKVIMIIVKVGKTFVYLLANIGAISLVGGRISRHVVMQRKWKGMKLEVASYLFDKMSKWYHVQVVHVFMVIRSKFSLVLVGNGLIAPVWDPGIGLTTVKLVGRTNNVSELLVDITRMFCWHRSSDNINQVWGTGEKWFMLTSLVHIDSICSSAIIPTYSPVYGGKGDLSAFQSLEDPKVEFDSLVLVGIREQNIPRSTSVYMNCMISGNVIRPVILLNASDLSDERAERTGVYDIILVTESATIQHMLFIFPFDPGQKFLPTTCYSSLFFSSLFDVYSEYKDMHRAVKLFKKVPHQVNFVLDQDSGFTKLRVVLPNVGSNESFKLVDELLEPSSMHVSCLFFGLINRLTADFFSYGFEKKNNGTIIVFDPGGTVLDVIDINYMKPIKFKLSLLCTSAQLRLLSCDTVEVLPSLFLFNQWFDGATAAVVFVQKAERKYHFAVFIERNELIVLLLLHLNTYSVFLIRISPLRIVKLNGSVTGILVNANALHFLYDAFEYVEIVQVWSSSILGIVADGDLKRYEMSISSWIWRFICSCWHTKNTELSHSGEITNYNLRGLLCDIKANGDVFEINWLAQCALLILLKLASEEFQERVIMYVKVMLLSLHFYSGKFHSCKQIHWLLHLVRHNSHSPPVSKLQFKREGYSVASLQFEVASVVEHWLALLLKTRTSLLLYATVNGNMQLGIASIEQLLQLQFGYWHWYFCGCSILPTETNEIINC